MAVKERAGGDVAVVLPGDSVREAADMMERQNVGSVIVVDEQNHPIGILSDRDLVIKVLGEVANIDAVEVEDVMTPAPVTIRQGSDIMDLFEVMSYHAIRRLPVVNDEGEVVNVVSFDDLVQLLADELSGLADVLASETGDKNIREIL